MKISESLGFPFRGPNVWANIGSALVCFLIPIIGPMVLLGYIIHVELVLRDNIHADAPRFDFGKFSRYLSRGVQMFLANLVLTLIGVVPMLFLVGACIVSGLFLLERHPAGAVMCFVGAGFVYVLGFLLVGMITGPLSFRAGMEDRFAAAFEFRFAMDYLRRVGLLSIGAHFLVMLVALPCLVLFCIPILNIFASYGIMAIFMLINAHLQMQLYHEYSARGGMEIQAKAEPPEPAFPVLPPPVAGGVGL